MATLTIASLSTIVFSVKKPSSSSFPSNSLKHCYIYNSHNHNPSRRLALFQLGSVIPQSQLLFGANAGEQEKKAPAISEQEALDWVKKDKRRMLHVVYNVGNLEKTMKFYTECLGMKILRQRKLPEEKFDNGFLGYGKEEDHFPVELTYNYGKEKYHIGNGFGHFGIAVEDVSKVVDLVKSKGGTVQSEPGPDEVENTKTALIEDSDGYTFKLLEKPAPHDPFTQVMLRVADIDKAVEFYKKAFGMELLRKKENPQSKSTTAMLSYGPEDKNAVLELTYMHGITKYALGDGYGQIAIGTDDIYKTAEVIRLFGGKIDFEPGPVPGLGTKVTACRDPDGWKWVFVDNIDFKKELFE